MTGDRARILGAEALGTFALVLFGCGAIMAMVYAFAHVSGALAFDALRPSTAP